MKISWATDIHFDHCDEETIHDFIETIKKEKADFLFLAGDLTHEGRAQTLVSDLQKTLGIPVYYVLGNHDYYKTDIESVRSQMHSAYYLTHQGIITLAPQTGLIGHDGWYDGKAGDFEHSDVDSILSDFFYIGDLMHLEKSQRLRKIQQLAMQSVDHIKTYLPEALKTHNHVFLLTHVPPYEECCLYEGKHSSPDFLPFFANISLGEVLKEIMIRNPDKTLSILCGHTHHAAFFSPIPNISVVVGFAEYGKPALQNPIFVDTYK